jgi:hypothetical protein
LLLEGSDDTVYVLALQTILEAPDKANKQNKRPSFLFQSAVSTPEYKEGAQIAAWAAAVESAANVANRKHNFTAYSKCFVGSDAISAVIAAKDLPSHRIKPIARLFSTNCYTWACYIT